jgi:hypothetical protein
MSRLAQYYKPLLTLSLIFLVFACGGGGCSGCEGCGIRPIPGAFPLDARIPNAAQVRLTSSGIGFIEDNIDPIVRTFLADGLEFPIPRQDVAGPLGVDITICGRSDCLARAEIEDIALTPTAPNRLRAVINLRLDSRDLAGDRRALPVTVDLGLFDADLNIDLDTTRGARTFVAVQADIDFVTETEPARAGYTRIDVLNFGLVEGQGIENDDIDISGDGIAGSIVSFLIGLFQSTVVNLLVDQISSLSDSLLGDNLCTTAGEFGCPTGTFADGTGPTAVCRFGTAADARCVPLLLGTDGRGDLGEAFLGGFSPGVHAPVQFVLGAGGDGEAISEGISLFMIGGFQSWNRDFTATPGHNACVPVITPPPLPTVARASAFRGNVIPGTATETHVGIGVSEDYLDYAGYGLFDAGALCIGTGTSLSQQLSTGLVSALIRSLNSLAFPAEDAPIAIALRPQQPPDFEIGTASGDPLLTVTLPELQLDFYVWSTERYVRFMTYQADLEIGINLVAEGGQLVPQIVGIVPSNSVVTNSELLSENPEVVAGTLESIITSFADMFASGISGFDLPAIMGFNLVVPAGGITGVDSDGETFLGIFANLELAGAAPVVAPVETSLEVSDLVLDRESMSLESWDRGERNTVWLHFDAEGPAGVEYEYSYRIDGTHWRPWTRERRVQIDDEILLLQARHTIEARARVAGEYATTDLTPASVDVLVDILAPTLEVEPTAAGWTIRGRDVVSGRDALEARFRLPGGEWTEWTHLVDGGLDVTADLASLPSGDAFGVELRDEAGNVSTSTLPIIRGIADPSASGSCACRAAGPRWPGALSSLLTLAVAGLLAARARSRRKEGARPGRTFRRLKAAIAIVFGLTLGLVVVGCSCGTPSGPPCNDECSPATGTELRGDLCCATTNECVSYNREDLCDPGFICPTDNVELDGCEPTCTMCERQPALAPGLLATDLDFVTTSMGDLVSGYSPGVPPNRLYGDLVFGEVGAGGEVMWEIVDGAPSSPITNDPEGWRGGVSAAGDDVGRWTSMVDSGGRTYIAYYDVTNGDLKIAIGAPMAWDIHTIDEAGDSGRYASMVLTASGAPAIAYLRIERQADGTVRSSVRVAVASSPMPAAAADWTITEVSGAATPCRGGDCAANEVCLDTGACVMRGTCTPACSGNDQVCAGTTCVGGYGPDFVEDLAPRHGMYAQLVATSTGLALVWYDRSTGNLWGASATGTTWGAPVLIDGYLLASGGSGGDSGLGASLFVDAAGTWHVTYVNAAEEELWYAQVTGGAVTTRERIDDGSTDGTTRHDDGRHVIGDDSSVVVLNGGEVRVAYQDTTDAHTMLARRTSPGTWSISVLDDVDANGFWVEQVLTGGGTGSTVATFWRRNETGNPNGVRITPVP